MRVTDDMIDSLVCPPPPTDPPVMSEEMISGLIVPAPGWSKYIVDDDDLFTIWPLFLLHVSKMVNAQPFHSINLTVTWDMC